MNRKSNSRNSKSYCNYQPYFHPGSPRKVHAPPKLPRSNNTRQMKYATSPKVGKRIPNPDRRIRAVFWKRWTAVPSPAIHPIKAIVMTTSILCINSSIMDESFIVWTLDLLGLCVYVHRYVYSKGARFHGY